MFGNLERTRDTFRIEALTASYLLRAELKPLGEILVYLNDRRRDYVRFEEVELQPIAHARQMRGVKREMMSVNKPSLLLVSLPVAEEVAKVQLIESSRPVVFYLGAFIVRGKLHINLDASDEDMLDDARDFYAVSDASIFPLEKLAATPSRQVPLLFVNRPHVEAYHIHQP